MLSCVRMKADRKKVALRETNSNVRLEWEDDYIIYNIIGRDHIIDGWVGILSVCSVLVCLAVIGTVLVISDVQLSQCMDGLDPDSEILCTGRSDRRCWRNDQIISDWTRYFHRSVPILANTDTDSFQDQQYWRNPGDIVDDSLPGKQFYYDIQ